MGKKREAFKQSLGKLDLLDQSVVSALMSNSSLSNYAKIVVMDRVSKRKSNAAKKRVRKDFIDKRALQSKALVEEASKLSSDIDKIKLILGKR